MERHAHTKREKNWKPLTLASRKDLNLFEERWTGSGNFDRANKNWINELCKFEKRERKRIGLRIGITIPYFHGLHSFEMHFIIHEAIHLFIHHFIYSSHRIERTIRWISSFVFVGGLILELGLRRPIIKKINKHVHYICSANQHKQLQPINAWRMKIH